MFKNLFLLFAIIVILIPLAFFVVLNNDVLVEYDYWIGKISIEAGMAVAGSFLIGILCTAVFYSLSASLSKIKANSLERQLNDLYREQQKKEIKKEFEAKNETA